MLIAGISTAPAYTVSVTAHDFCDASTPSPCPSGRFDINLTTPTTATGSGILTLELFDDFKDTLEFVTVEIEDTSSGSIFNNNGDDPFDLSPDTGNEYQTSVSVSAIIDGSLLKCLISDGEFIINFTLAIGSRTG